MNWKQSAAAIVGFAVMSAAASGQSLPNPFFAMDTGTRDATHKTPAEQVAMIKELGYAGIGPIYHGVADLQEWFAALDKAGLKMFALYVPLRLDSIEASVASLKEVAAALKGRETMLWLYVTEKGRPPSSTDNDDAAVKALREVAAIAREAGLRVAMYPHTGFYVARVEDAARLADKAGCKNLGLTFNLCHWLKVDGKDLDVTLKAAQPHLFCVSINGADADGKDWKVLIQPLDRGTYDVAQLLRRLKKMGYTGPIGLQHYGIKGDACENLKHSMDGWKKLSAAAAKE
ncbi:MAG: sugar phosphate isomerase/epimerase family protein [Verrucomicrobiia bacterium]|jgi:sugar phosphate isomerase/epimerase